MIRQARTLIGDDSAPRKARQWVHEVIDPAILDGDRPHLVQDVIRDVVLCASELVNASLIAGCTTMTLALELDQGFVQLDLRDDGDADQTNMDGLLPAQLMGLRILDELANSWGITTLAEGRQLWANFGRQASSSIPDPKGDLSPGSH